MSKPNREAPPDGVEIGPVAQHLLLENAEIKIWQVDTPAGETFGHPYHDTAVSTNFKQMANCRARRNNVRA